MHIKPLWIAGGFAALAATLSTGCASFTDAFWALPPNPDTAPALEWELRPERGTPASPKIQAPSIPSASRKSLPGQEVLGAGHRIAVVEERIVTGSCWDFVNVVYDAAGFPGPRRATVFQSSRAGPYADPGLIQPGDWVMHLNLEFGEVEHSSIFVQWLDREKRVARTLGYAGMNRSVPGRYSAHQYSKVFAIIRAAEER